jgi:hypothetical protein
MILGDTQQLIQYSSASNMARVFVESIEKIEQAKLLVKEAEAAMNEAFQPEKDYKGFDACVSSGSYHDRTEQVKELWKLKAWSTLVDRVGIRKVMSAKRRKDLDEILSNYHKPSGADSLPDITEATIVDVLLGYAQSAEEFLEEAIREEYDFWKCHNTRAELKTNLKSLWKLDRKVIKGYMVESWSGGKFEVKYERRGHVAALDNIFHCLDGRGAIQGTNGPLCDTIAKSHGGGETDLFSFRCFKNGNLHLEFKRLDLLEKFNAICGRNRLPGV